MVKKKESFFEKVEAEVISSAEGYVKDKVVRKLVKIGEVSVSFLVGFLLVLIGLVQLIGYYYPILDNGLNFLIIGFLFLLIGYFLKI